MNQNLALNIWKVNPQDDPSKPDLYRVTTVSPLFYYEIDGSYNILLTEDELETIVEAFKGMTEAPNEYAEIDRILGL